MSIVDKYIIREMNEKLVLNTIIKRETISRADLSKITRLNKTTISSIVADLISKDLVIEIGCAASSGGRKPIMITFNNKAGFSLSFDVGPNYITSLLTYLDGQFVADDYTPLEEVSVDLIMKSLESSIETYLKNLPTSTYGIIGICIGLHGIVDKNQLIFSPFYKFEQVNLKEKLEAKFNISISIENEANLAALGEQQNTKTPASNLISLSVKYGIGAGIILNDTLYTGTNGHAGEIGHITTVSNGHQCPCGNRGCLEQYASEHRILKTYSETLGLERVSFAKFKSDYFAGNPEAKKLMAQFTEHMTIAINNLITTFNPEVIIINSKFTNQIDDTINQIKDQITYKGRGKTIITASNLDRKSTLLGGVYINITRFLN